VLVHKEVGGVELKLDTSKFKDGFNAVVGSDLCLDATITNQIDENRALGHRISRLLRLEP